MTGLIRGFAPLLAIAAVVGAACEPAKPPPPPPPPGLFIASYLTNESGGTGLRTPVPHSFAIPGGGTASQTLSGDGSVELGVNGTTVSARTAIQTVPFVLAALESIEVELAPGSVARIALFLDKDGDGDFAAWAANGSFAGNGSDAAPIDGFTLDGGDLIVGDATEFLVCPGPGPGTCPGVIHTLAELKAGAEPGIGAFTVAAVSVHTFKPLDTPFPASPSATVTSLKVNGTELLVP
jgi:hypothetical protein